MCASYLYYERGKLTFRSDSSTEGTGRTQIQFLI